MKGFILSPAAIADLDAIWDRTADVWSIAQADRYNAEIKQACMALGDGGISGRPIDDVRSGYFKRSVGSHFIICRVVGEVIDVVRILHQKMDLPAICREMALRTEKRQPMPLRTKLLLIILDGVPYRNWRRLMGNLEGWVQSGDARVWTMRSVLPSTSACCYASIHTGVSPQVHGVLSNEGRFRVSQPDIFSEVTKAGGKTGAVTHSYWSEFFSGYPFDLVEDMEYDRPGGPITHGRFHTMTGYGHANQMTPSDLDLFATLTMLTRRFSIDYGILHTCTLDSMGHRFGHDCGEMDHAVAVMDAQLAAFLPKWIEAGYEVMVTADHGQTDRGHHGGREDLQQDVAFYYFGKGEGPADNILLDQLQLAPTILSLLGVPVPETMKAKPFLG